MILISACLAGINCRYDGVNNLNLKIKKLVDEGKAILVCPEEEGGLSTPREPSELKGERVLSISGKDVTKEFKKGAEKAVELINEYGIKEAILQERSPSCGVHYVYDGTHSKTLIPGAGLTTQLLRKNGVKVYSLEDYFGEQK